jgi:hypothetical protein
MFGRPQFESINDALIEVSDYKICHNSTSIYQLSASNAPTTMQSLLSPEGQSEFTPARMALT